MNYSLPHTIESHLGEILTFKSIRHEPDGDVLIAHSFTQPGSGPPMHTHWLQDEGFTVLEGRIGYQMAGQPAQYAGPGESVVFKRGVSHRFWNAGSEVLHCEGWLKPANHFVFFLSSVYAAQNKSGKAQPELFDAAYLLTRYASEYKMDNIPPFVTKVVMPVVYRLGKLLNKYEHFKNAPEPIQQVPVLMNNMDTVG
ncbi:cupin 2 domain-containing protein [Fibrisoma limi BUZ 3]|uniref:Cupin 2 domain-containing protein n=1 Tax=Fibrisoma limi BUZ 3 TaxID=1185876 RepID=I2GLF0_9BACT|nr:cupin domain-containing protein [Fibrisoma limi]CCH54726.1 cupin 2 domain-containing protein [Fibrisoma limi BUZ 3]